MRVSMMISFIRERDWSRRFSDWKWARKDSLKGRVLPSSNLEY